MMKYGKPQLEAGYHVFDSCNKDELWRHCTSLSEAPTAEDITEWVEELVLRMQSVTVPEGYESPYKFGRKMRQLIDDDLAGIYEFNSCYIAMSEAGKTVIYNPGTAT